MQPQEELIVQLDSAAVRLSSIAGIGKGVAPKTLNTPEIPYISIYVYNLSEPIVVMYETEERRDAEYDTIFNLMVKHRVF